MSQAAQNLPAGPPDQPARRPGRTRLLLAPVAAVLLIIAIPGFTYALVQNQLSQAQASEAKGAYGQALDQFATVENLAGNPVSRVLLGDLADRAHTGAAETHFLWGVQLTHDGKFDAAETQLRAAVSSGIADWASRGNAALADLFIAWGQSQVAAKQFQAGIDKLGKVASFDPTGNLTASTNAALATAYLGYAQSFLDNQPPDYANALSWFEKLVKEFPDSPEAKTAQATLLPQTLYNAGLAFVQLKRYQPARDAMTELVQKYPSSPWAALANAALQAKQPLSGKLIVSDANQTPVANRLIRVASKWRIVQPHVYDDSGGPAYSTATDANGNFTVPIPPGEHYLVTWWDPTRKTFVTTFVSDNVPVNIVTINPLEPAYITVATS